MTFHADNGLVRWAGNSSKEERRHGNHKTMGHPSTRGNFRKADNAFARRVQKRRTLCTRKGLQKPLPSLPHENCLKSALLDRGTMLKRTTRGSMTFDAGVHFLNYICYSAMRFGTPRKRKISICRVRMPTGVRECGLPLLLFFCSVQRRPSQISFWQILKEVVVS